MSKLIGLLLGSFVLIGVISAGGDKEILNAPSVWDKSDIKTLRSSLEAEEVEQVLLKVDADKRDEVEFPFLDYINVAQVLSFSNPGCNMEAFADSRILVSSLPWELPGLQGVLTFINAHQPQLIESCTKDFYSLLKKALDDFGESDERIVQKLHSSRLNTRWGKWPKKSEKQDESFDVCVRLIKTLSVAKEFDRKHQVALNDAQRKFMDGWYDKLETCKLYTEKQCEPHYIPWPVQDPSPPKIKPFNDDDELFDLKTKCLSISDIGISDKTRKERTEEFSSLREQAIGKKTKESHHSAMRLFGTAFKSIFLGGDLNKL